MGGLALKHLNVKRIGHLEYEALTASVLFDFVALFAQRPVLVQAYETKPDFGDCDLLICAQWLPADWRARLAADRNSKGWVENGTVTSMEIDGVQFDFISVPPQALAAATVYFSFNDLGNLMGRVAHKMGFKYGHLGLQKVIRDGDHVSGVIEVSSNPPDIFNFLGYSWIRYTQGFATLEDIFQFTASSPYFNPDIYLLHNRNNFNGTLVSEWTGLSGKPLGQFMARVRELPGFEAAVRDLTAIRAFVALEYSAPTVI